MSDEDPIEGGLAIATTGAAAMARAAEVLIRQAQETKARAAAEVRQNVEELRKQLDARTEYTSAAWVYWAEVEKPGWLNQLDAQQIGDVVHAAHAWAEIDPERFGERAERLRDRVAATFGVDLREAYAENQNAAALAELARTGVLEARGTATASGLGSSLRDPLGADATRSAGSSYDAPESREARSQALAAAGATEAAVTARAVSDQLNGHDPRGTAAAAAAGKTKTPAKAARRAPSRQAGQQRGR